MIKILCVLSQENIPLAKLEIESLLHTTGKIVDEYLFIADVSSKNLAKVSRLACTKKVGEILFTSSTVQFEKTLTRFDFSKQYTKDFAVRMHGTPSKISGKIIDEKYLAGFVWRSIEKEQKKEPKVNLSNPTTHFEFFFEKDVYCARMFWENTERFDDRKAHKRPALIPTSMHPKLARTLVNILDSKTIVDPCCGSGGILIEAGLMGLTIKGYDIDDSSLRKAQDNFSYYKISGILAKKDFHTFKTLKNVVTDLPYGKSSRAKGDIEQLYMDFVQRIAGRAVIVMPDFVNLKKIFKKSLSSKLTVQAIIPYYVHKSLTRMIVVIDEKRLIRKDNYINMR